MLIPPHRPFPAPNRAAALIVAICLAVSACSDPEPTAEESVMLVTHSGAPIEDRVAHIARVGEEATDSNRVLDNGFARPYFGEDGEGPVFFGWVPDGSGSSDQQTFDLVDEQLVPSGLAVESPSIRGDQVLRMSGGNCNLGTTGGPGERLDLSESPILCRWWDDLIVGLTPGGLRLFDQTGEVVFERTEPLNRHTTTNGILVLDVALGTLRDNPSGRFEVYRRSGSSFDVIASYDQRITVRAINEFGVLGLRATPSANKVEIVRIPHGGEIETLMAVDWVGLSEATYVFASSDGPGAVVTETRVGGGAASWFGETGVPPRELMPSTLSARRAPSGSDGVALFGPDHMVILDGSGNELVQVAAPPDLADPADGHGARWFGSDLVAFRYSRGVEFVGSVVVHVDGRMVKVPRSIVLDHRGDELLVRVDTDDGEELRIVGLDGSTLVVDQTAQIWSADFIPSTGDVIYEVESAERTGERDSTDVRFSTRDSSRTMAEGMNYYPLFDAAG